MRYLIVNADDFGHSAEVNAGVAETHERGIVTSTSLMVHRPAAEAAAAYARRQAGLSLGLHVDLGEWAYRDGDGWVALREVPAEDVEHEVRAQLRIFRELAGRDPTHLDSHQHVHRREPALSAVLALGRELDVPVRHFESLVRYCGEFYGQTETGKPLPDSIGTAALVRLLQSLPEGTTELCCHPGKGAVQGTSYALERVWELEALCDPEVREALNDAGIRLCSFGDRP